jgi:hypothetical protein
MGVRHYSADDGIFRSRDKLFEKYYWLSSYTAMANAWTKFVDPSGMIIDPESETEWNNKKQEITDRKAGVDGEISRISAMAKEKGWSDKKLSREMGDLKERSASLEKTLNTMNNLANDQENIYALRESTGDGKFGPGTGKNAGKMEIRYSNTASFVHEVTHGGQYYDKEISWAANGDIIGLNITHEVNAFQAAFAYNPQYYNKEGPFDPKYPYINFLSEITPDWVRNRMDAKGEYPYKKLPAGPVNVK